MWSISICNEIKFLIFSPFLQAFHDELMAEEVNVQSAIKKGQVIARFCHPSALPIIQQWIARLKKRWDEVSNHEIPVMAVLLKI